MAAEGSFSLVGVEQVLKNMEYVSDTVRGKKGRAALRKAGMIVVNAAKAAVERNDDPETGRKISDNVAIRWNGRRNKATGDIAWRIGVLKGARLPKNNHEGAAAGTATPHWRLLEFGTKTAIAKPFLRPALANNVGAVTASFVDELTKGIASAIKTGKTL